MSKNEAEANALNEEYIMDYSSVIGSLIYLLNTRPDLTFAVTKLAKFMVTPGREHFKALLHALHYLQDKCNFGLKFYHNIDDSPGVHQLFVTHGKKIYKPIYGIHDSS